MINALEIMSDSSPSGLVRHIFLVAAIVSYSTTLGLLFLLLLLAQRHMVTYNARNDVSSRPEASVARFHPQASGHEQWNTEARFGIRRYGNPESRRDSSFEIAKVFVRMNHFARSSLLL